MKMWKMGAILGVVIIGLFLIPFLKPSIVPMMLHKNADYTEERFMSDMKDILADEYDAIIEPELVSGFTYRKGLGVYHGWTFERNLNGDQYAMNIAFIDIYFNPPRNLTLADVIDTQDTQFSYLQKGSWESPTRMVDLINTSRGVLSVQWHRELPSGNITNLRIDINPSGVVGVDKSD